MPAPIQNRLCYNSVAPLVDAAHEAHLPGPINDASDLRKLQLLVAFTTIFSLAGAVGCRGFFRDPQLTRSRLAAKHEPSTREHPADDGGRNFDDGSTSTLTHGVFCLPLTLLLPRSLRAGP